MVRAHYTVISALPCPTFSGVCQTGEDCVVHTTPLPYTGQKPASGWCVRQWQRTVPSNYKANVNVGSNVNVFLSLWAGPSNQSNPLRLNQPPYCSLPPPLRARVNCPHHFPLTVKDLDGDTVRCRFARADLGECLDCPQHNFLKMEEESCTLLYNGKSSAGQYSVQLMVEDFSKSNPNRQTQSTQFHPTAPVPYSGGGVLKLHFRDGHHRTNTNSVSEIVVVGPPGLFRTALETKGSLATMNLTWIRGPNNLPPLLPLCFMANTNSLQSEPRCVWLYQRQMETIPTGTELTCGKTEMNLVLPISTLKNLIVSELQLNHPSCSVTSNSTHVMARISLTGCGTKRVVRDSAHCIKCKTYIGSFPVVVPDTLVQRWCTPTPCGVRIHRHQSAAHLDYAARLPFPGGRGQGPAVAINMPSEQETFGIVKFCVSAERRPVRTASRLDTLDLHVFSNTSLDRAELMVGKCMESETEDMADSFYILEQGQCRCTAGNGTLEILTSTSTARVYRIDLSTINTKGTTMYVECTVYLCVTTRPSQKCPDQCDRDSSNQVTVDNMLTRSYSVRSGPVRLVPTTAALATTTVFTTTIPTATSTTAAPTTTASNAPAEDSTMAVGVVLAVVHVFLQGLLHH
ncbi:uncharacterized protein LOC121566685 [Coregonus clupeaformis]|uniref:uncharacterized protein LOC121566685 n=1 Tax=Coregonus clupeaformis TaxID=59861 RepID=UPI001E1C8A3E|nr:uncharacterized protein LOC121566685 [Coregonus clupeaformis]